MAVFKASSTPSRSPETATERQTRSRMGCWLLGALLFFGLPLLLLAVLVLTIVFRERTARQELLARLAERQQQGLPNDNASLDSYYRQLTSEAKTEAWLSALAELKAQGYEAAYADLKLEDLYELGFPAPGAVWNEEVAIREFLEVWKGTHRQLQLLGIDQREQALPVRWPLEFQSFNTELEPIQEMRQAARLLRLKGQLAVYDRDSAGTRRSVAALLGTSEAVATHPILVASLVAIALDGMAIGLLKDALEHDVLDEGDLTAILPMLQRHATIGEGYRVAIEGEIGLALPIFDDPNLSGEEVPVGLPARSRDALIYLEHMQRIAGVPTQDLTEFQQGIDLEEASLRQQLSTGWVQRFDSIFTGLLAPAVGAAGNAFIRQCGQHRIASLAVAVRLYEKRQGQFPAVLGDLTVVGVDVTRYMPPGAQPFGYKAEKQRAVLWGAAFDRGDAIPPEPPTIDPSEPNAWVDTLWTWRLLKQATAAAGEPALP